MLTITDRAGAVLSRTLQAVERPEAAIRFSTAAPDVSGNGSAHTVRVDVVEAGAADDEVPEAPGGASVLIDARIAPWVDDKVLDASVDGDGRTALVLVGRPEG